MNLIPASEVPSGQLSEFFGRMPEGEQAFLCAHIYTRLAYLLTIRSALSSTTAQPFSVLEGNQIAGTVLSADYAVAETDPHRTSFF